MISKVNCIYRILFFNIPDALKPKDIMTLLKRLIPNNRLFLIIVAGETMLKIICMHQSNYAFENTVVFHNIIPTLNPRLILNCTRALQNA